MEYVFIFSTEYDEKGKNSYFRHLDGTCYKTQFYVTAKDHWKREETSGIVKLKSFRLEIIISERNYPLTYREREMGVGEWQSDDHIHSIMST